MGESCFIISVIMIGLDILSRRKEAKLEKSSTKLRRIWNIESLRSVK
jgi:hypothetical protein